MEFVADTFLGAFGVAGAVIGNFGNKRIADKEIIYRDSSNSLKKLTIYRKAEFSDLSRSEQIISSCAIVVVTVSYIWSVVDAYQSAKAFNRKHFIPSKHTKISIMPIINENNLGMAAVHRF